MAEIRCNCAQSGTAAVSTWNKLQLASTFSNLLNSTDDVTGVSATVSSNWEEAQISGPTSGNLYDNAVWRTGFKDPAYQQEDAFPSCAYITIAGLEPNEPFDFELFCTTGYNASYPNDNLVEFRLVGDTTTGYSTALNAQANTTNVATRTVDSDGDGEIRIEMQTTAGVGYVILGGFIITGTFPTAAVISSSPATAYPGQTNLTVEGVNLTSVDAINIIWDDVTVAQTGLTIVDDTELNFDFVQGHLPYGTATLELLIGAVSSTALIEIIPATNYSFLTVEDAIFDHATFQSVGDSAPGPGIVDGDQLELHDTTGDVTIYQNMLYSISDASTLSFNVRRWSITSHEWEPTEKTFTMDVPVVEGVDQAWYKMLLLG